LQNDYGKRQQGLRNFANRIPICDGGRSFEDKLENSSASIGGRAEFDEQLRKMRLVWRTASEVQAGAKRTRGLRQGDSPRQRHMGNGPGGGAMTSAAGMTEDDFLQKISTKRPGFRSEEHEPALPIWK